MGRHPWGGDPPGAEDGSYKVALEQELPKARLASLAKAGFGLAQNCVCMCVKGPELNSAVASGIGLDHFDAQV